MSFVPATGQVVVTSADGGRAVWMPPFTSQDQINSYASSLKQVSSLKKTGLINILSTVLQPNTNVYSVSPMTTLPAVQIYNMPNLTPPIFAVVYTDQTGQSQFSYKNDPNNLITLIPYGSTLLIPPGPSPTTLANSTSTTTVENSQPIMVAPEVNQNYSISATVMSLSCGFVCLVLIIIAVMKSQQS